NFCASERFWLCAMVDHTDTPGLPGSAFPFLLSICLVSAAIIIILGIASISSLDLGKGMESISGSGDRVEAKSMFFEPLPINGNTARVPADATPPDSDADLIKPPSPPSPVPAAKSTQQVGSAPPQPVERPLPRDEQVKPGPGIAPVRASTTSSISDR